MALQRKVGGSRSFSAEDLTAVVISDIVRKIEACMADLQKAWMGVAHGDAPLETRASVSYKRSIYRVLEQIGKARDFIDTLLAADTEAGHPRLQEMFGGDCMHLATIQCCLETLAPLLEGSNMAEDARLRNCCRACDTVQSVLVDIGLGARLAQAKAEAMAAAETARHVVEEEVVTTAPSRRGSEEESNDPASAEMRSFDSRPPMRPRAKTAQEEEERAKMLEDIDATKSVEVVIDLVDELFNKYDADENGLLEGDEYTRVLEDLTKHIHKEATVVQQRLGRRFVPPEDVLRQWVIDVVDPNHDGAISREEARVGFKKVVNDIKS